MQQGKKRLVADRFRRIWGIAEEIAAVPGHSRAELADRFCLSERQVQADLNIIKDGMLLPLVRRRGYRFAGEGGADGGSGGLTLQQGQLLVLACQRAMRDRSIPNGPLAETLRRVPGLLAPHLRPLMARLVGAVTGPPGREQQVMLALADATLRGGWVRLHYPLRAVGEWEDREPVVRPELLLPYLDGWFVLGERQKDGRSRMWSLDGVTAVTLATDGAQGVGY